MRVSGYNVSVILVAAWLMVVSAGTSSAPGATLTFWSPLGATTGAQYRVQVIGFPEEFAAQKCGFVEASFVDQPSHLVKRLL